MTHTRLAAQVALAVLVLIVLPALCGPLAHILPDLAGRAAAPLWYLAVAIIAIAGALLTAYALAALRHERKTP